MNIVIFGATGFIGQELTKRLINNHNVTVISRSLSKISEIFGDAVDKKEVDYKNTDQLSKIMSDNDVVINLAGENIASSLWTKKQKQKIINSRIKVGDLITKSIALAVKKPQMLIQASAIGYYGNNATNRTENSNKGRGFLSDITELWEKSTKEVEVFDVRRVIIRTGVVLGSSGGILPKLILPIKYYLGTQLGNGKNYISWIHIQDEIRAIEHLINNKESQGTYNLTSPEPVMSKELNYTAGNALNRPVWLRIPRFIIELILGDLGKELLLADQKIYPTKLLREGFEFKYKNISNAISSLLK